MTPGALAPDLCDLYHHHRTAALGDAREICEKWSFARKGTMAAAAAGRECHQREGHESALITLPVLLPLSLLLAKRTGRRSPA